MPLVAGGTYTFAMAPQRKSSSTSTRKTAPAGRKTAKPTAASRAKQTPASRATPARKKAAPAPAARPAASRTRSARPAKSAKPGKPAKAAKPARSVGSARSAKAIPATAAAKRSKAAKPVTPAPRTRKNRATLRTREAEVAASKFAASDAAGLPEDVSSIPQSYGRTRVRLLMQSPGRLFVHWDLSPGVLEEVKAQLGQRVALLARLAIRITTPGVQRPLLVLLPRGARSWYVDVPGQRLEYRADIGLMLPSGEFRPVAQSNPLRMPRTAPSPVSAERSVAIERDVPPDAEALGDLPADEPTQEERLAAAESTFDGVVVDAEELPAPGGSSELSGGRARRARGNPRGGRPDLGGSSDLAPAGSSSDLRPRR